VDKPGRRHVITALDGIIFDLDGTVAETRDVCIEAFQHAIELYTGERPTPRGVVGLWGPTEEGVLREAVGPEWQSAVDTYLAEYERLHASIATPFPGIRSLLDRLAEVSIPTAIVTGKGPRSTRISLEVLGLNDVFEFVEAGSIDGAVKARKITRVVERWGVPARSVAYVGDHPHDALEAHEAGVIAVAAAWSVFAEPEALRGSGPDEYFDSVVGFAEWVEAAIGTR
jgi:phosphoglycolate phosphatase-like HAD superfamily hydrolase